MDNCFYCTKDETLTEIMLEVCPLGVSTLYLFKEQTHKGRCIVAYKYHGRELFDLSDDELALFMQDVKKAATAINKAFSPGKINYGAYADKQKHLHFHIVPKYEGGYCWGTTFEMNPEKKTLLSDEEYGEVINKIKEQL